LTVLYSSLIRTIKENTEALLQAGREVGLEVNTQKIKHIVISSHQNVAQNQNLLIADKTFEDVAKFNCLGTSLTN
jgi:hypothetical protein